MLPDPPPAKILFLSAGSGITPVMAMLRTLDRRGTMPDVLLSLHLADRGADDLPRRAAGARRARTRASTLHEQHTDTDGMLEIEELDRACARTGASARPGRAARRRCSTPPRSTGSGPASADRCTSSGSRSTSGGDGGEGGTLTFTNSSKSVEADGATTVLEAGEEAGVGMPYGCRDGHLPHLHADAGLRARCATCATATSTPAPTRHIQTCVTVAAGDCTLDI